MRRIQSIKAQGEVIGNRTRVKVKKNKVAPPFTECEFDIMYNTGISKEGDVLDLAVDYDLVDKRGAYYRYDDLLLGQGRENAKTYLLENPDLLARLDHLPNQAVAYRLPKTARHLFAVPAQSAHGQLAARLVDEQQKAFLGSRQIDGGIDDPPPQAILIGPVFVRARSFQSLTQPPGRDRPADTSQNGLLEESPFHLPFQVGDSAL